jgi:hypothetical protein
MATSAVAPPLLTVTELYCLPAGSGQKRWRRSTIRCPRDFVHVLF